MNPIYKVTDPNVIKHLIEELERLAAHARGVDRKVKKLMKEEEPKYKGGFSVFAQDIAFLDPGMVQSFIGPVVTDPDKPYRFDRLKWRVDARHYGHILTPKKNTKAGRDLYDKLREILKPTPFMHDPKIAKALNYENPESGFNGKDFMAYRLRFGTSAKSGAFYFFGYPGYRPMGAKEVLVSEYNYDMNEGKYSGEL